MGAVSLKTALVVWEALLLGSHAQYTVWQRAVNPAAVVRFAVRVNETGTWSMGHSYGSSSAANSDAVSGWGLTAIWAIEAVTLLVAPVVVGRATLSSVPFCDACDAWCDTKGLVRSTALTDPNELRQKLEGGDFAYVAALPPPAPGSGLEFTRHSCGTCGQMNTLTVTRKVVARNKKGKVVKNETKVLVDKLLVSTDDLRKLVPAAPPVGTAAPPRPA